MIPHVVDEPPEVQTSLGLDRDAMWDVARQLAPEITEAEFQAMWDEMQERKRAGGVQ